MKTLLSVLMLATPVLADPPEILSSSVDAQGRVTVTLRHPDTGWDHYADGWRIETEDGEVLGTRVLHHPHVNEQPFSRSLGGVVLPDDAPLYLRARCSVDGWNEIRVPLMR